MRKSVFFIAACAVACLYGCNDPQSVTVSVTNPIDRNRTGEMVEVPIAQVFEQLNLPDTAQVVIYDNKAQEVPYQLTYDDKIIFPVSVDANATVDYIIQKGNPSIVNAVVYGRHYPERMDDIAWENDRIAYRAYGPALQKTGEKAYGYDIFTKRVEELVIEDRYRMELDSASRARIAELKKVGKMDEAEKLQKSISYHIDHGNGMDCYAVGPTLGGGASALMPDSNIVYPYCYNDYEILDNGPLRFTVRLTFNPLAIKKDSNVIETRIIRLDKGSQLNRTTVTYENLSQQVPVVGGVVIHAANPKGYSYSTEEGYIAYDDPTTDADADNGTLYVGAVFPAPLSEAKVQMFDKPSGDAIGHILGISDYEPSDEFVYYWGAGWSKYGFEKSEDWRSYLRTYAAEVRNPLIVTVHK